VYHQYTVRLDPHRRDAAAQVLGAAGIGNAVYYPVPVHRLPVYAATAGSLPVSEAAAESVLSLPIWPTMPDEAIERVVTVLRGALDRPR
jgi:dTDP-4-amino-4,6-dideoxygalactose transaminase